MELRVKVEVLRGHTNRDNEIPESRQSSNANFSIVKKLCYEQIGPEDRWVTGLVSLGTLLARKSMFCTEDETCPERLDFCFLEKNKCVRSKGKTSIMSPISFSTSRMKRKQVPNYGIYVKKVKWIISLGHRGLDTWNDWDNYILGIKWDQPVLIYPICL